MGEDAKAKPRKIVLLSDGTGNSAASPTKTNVWRTYKALDLSEESGQIAYYDQGVGTSRFTPLAILGLGFGIGLARNVREIYAFLCRSYRDGDRIYAFGFSRGAFTIRVVAALIASQGIVDPNRAKDDRDLNRLVLRAYRTWRRDAFVPSLLSFVFRPLRDGFAVLSDKIQGLPAYVPEKNRRYDAGPSPAPLIDFLGVWDTVDAYGLPIDELTRAWDMVVWPLTAKDRDLSPRVKRACHALALDERRESFEPMLWNEDKDGTPDPRILQVWFTGMHADIGGGYADDALAYGALDWMLEESSKDDGLKFIPCERGRLKGAIDHLGPLHNSRTGTGNLYRYAPRDIESLCDAKNPGLWNWLLGLFRSAEAVPNEVTVKKPKIHHSVFERIALGGDGYAPINLPADYSVVAPNGSAVDIAPDGSAVDIAAPGTPPLHGESPQQAKDRHARQKAVWTKVWLRKALYLLTLALVICFIAFPYSIYFDGLGAKFDDFAGVYVGNMRNVLAALPGLLNYVPGMSLVEDWIDLYQTQPFSFLFLLIVIGLLIYASMQLKASLISEMRSYYQHVTHIGDPPAGRADEQGGAVASFLDSPLYKNWVAKSFGILLEALAVLFLLFLIVALASRIVFLWQDGFVGVCESQGDGTVLAGRQEMSFDPKSFCFDTGINVEQGQAFKITMEIKGGWMDGDIPADAEGWEDAPLYSYGAVPLRRHIFADWYQPVAQVGETLFDRYPLEENCVAQKEERKPEGAETKTRKVCMKIKPRRDGRLYFYLNDAVFFTPGSPLEFYRNNNCKKADGEAKDGDKNRGNADSDLCYAKVTIEPIKQEKKKKGKGKAPE